MKSFGAEVLSPAFVLFDFSQYDEAWKKSTALLSHGIDMSFAGRRCTMTNGLCSRTGCRHTVLE
eukprot:6245073-Pyramimonas_sp.AAC.1